MSRSFTRDFLIEVEKGNVPGHSIVHKFGHNGDVATANYVPVTVNGIYRTPQLGGATTLRIGIGDAADIDTTGAGARKIFVQGVDATGALVNDTLSTNGTSAGSVGSQAFMRIFRAYVAESGSYADATTPSHVGEILIETSGGVEWTTIHTDEFPTSQSEIGVYTVPLGKTAYLLNYTLTTNANKEISFLFFKRENILETAAPYSAMRLQFDRIGITVHIEGNFERGIRFPPLTDFGFMARAAGSGSQASASFDILLVDD
jgi:hypothetical protein